MLLRFTILFIIAFITTTKSFAFDNNSLAPADTSLSHIDSVVIAKAHALHDYVKSANKLVEYLDPSKKYDLPIGIRKFIGGIEYIIVVETITLNSEGGFLTAYMSMEIPASGKRVAFRGTDIRFNEGGISGFGKLLLAGDFPLKVSEQLLLTLKGNGNTYIRFDCNGFSDMGIEAQLEVSRDIIIPENPDGTLNESERVKTNIRVEGMREWGDIVTKITLPAFQVKGLTGFGFQVKDAVFDYSEFANLSGLSFPQDYYSVNPDASSPIWQGIYIKDVALRFPKQFESTDNRRLEFGVSNLIIDNVGFTGSFRIMNPLPLDKGKIGSWNTSIDSIAVVIKAGQLTGGAFKGRMIVPMFDENDPLIYTAVINTGGNYLFSAETTGDKKIPLWSAKAEIHPGSTLIVNVTNDKFLPKVILHGKLTVGAGDDTDVSLADITFENLQIQTVKPYLQVGSFALSSEKLQQKMSNFPITLNKIGLSTRDNQAGILLDMSVNLVGESDGGFAAQGQFTVWGEQKEKSWKFKTVELNNLRVDIQSSGFELHGAIFSYKQDPVYGKGFKGTISAIFTPGLQVEATAQFGNKGFRYWYADALLVLPSGIPVCPAFGLYGFGGGAYYKMRQVNPEKAKAIPTTTSGNLTDNSTSAGKTLSGITYVPDDNISIGIKAKVVIGTIPSPKAFNGDAGFEIAFGKTGAIEFIGFSGKAYFMTDIEKRSTESPVYASLNLEYTFSNKTLFGNLDVFMNVAGGAIRGIGEGNKAGSAVMYFAPSEWYIHIGTPENRVGLRMMNVFETNSYLMVGTSMPGMPEPPANVTAILGGGDFNFMRDENALGKGAGFAFGAGMSISTGDLTYMIFYGRFDAGAGFDLMMKNYGSDIRCSGRSEPLGINGWYASGQAYAYLQARIGIKVDLAFVKGNYEILNMGAAAILQTKLPNPFWMKGTVGGRYEILGGLVKGNCKFEATIGEKCVLDNGGSLVAGIKVIEEITPSLDSKDISVFNAPQVSFNMEVGKTFELVDLDDSKKSFRIVLDYFKVLNGSNEISVIQKWNDSKDVLAIQSIDVLPQKTRLKAIAKIHFETIINGSWQPVITSGKIVEEIKETSFTTGTAPNEIPHSNVAFSYPLIDQFNFYSKEFDKGYIQLIQGQDYLFVPTNDFKQVARLKAESGQIDFDFTYNSADNRVNFTIPKGIEKDKVYNFILVNIPQNATAKVDANAVKKVSNLTSDGSVTVQKNTLEGNLDILQETNVYTAYFRTSKYGTLAEKLNALRISNGWSWPILDGVHELGVNIEGNELFDAFEIKGNGKVNPLLQFQASADDKWIKNKIGPLLYNKYPLAGSLYITWRNTDSLGICPFKAICIRQDEDSKKLSEGEYSGNAIPVSSQYAQFVYTLPFYAYYDYVDLQNKSANYISVKYNEQADRLLSTPFPTANSGSYTFVVKYVLPGTNNVVSEKVIKINNQ